MIRTGDHDEKRHREAQDETEVAPVDARPRAGWERQRDGRARPRGRDSLALESDGRVRLWSGNWLRRRRDGRDGRYIRLPGEKRLEPQGPQDRRDRRGKCRELRRGRQHLGDQLDQRRLTARQYGRRRLDGLHSGTSGLADGRSSGAASCAGATGCGSGSAGGVAPRAPAANGQQDRRRNGSGTTSRGARQPGLAGVSRVAPAQPARHGARLSAPRTGAPGSAERARRRSRPRTSFRSPS